MALGSQVLAGGSHLHVSNHLSDLRGKGNGKGGASGLGSSGVEDNVPERADTGIFFFGAAKRGGAPAAGVRGGGKGKRRRGDGDDDGIDNENNTTLYVGFGPGRGGGDHYGSGPGGGGGGCPDSAALEAALAAQVIRQPQQRASSCKLLF